MSSISGAMGLAQAGMSSGLARVGKAAEAMTKEVSPEAVLDSKLGEQQFKASAKVAVAIDRSLGQLIDTLG